ncbi:MAG TPA: PilT/PilU family type 4a pilus ATPase [Actinomycetota bacterium]
MVKIETLLAGLVESEGSDLHLKVGMPPLIRVQGQLVPFEMPPMSVEDTARFADELLPARKRAQLSESGDAEVARSFDALGRYRINAYLQRGVVGLVMRLVIAKIPTIEELSLPPIVAALAEERRGLILVTGPAGTGKTTTIAAMIGHINRTRRCHVITLEDPIEVVHRDEMASIDQREVGSDIPSYASGLRFAVRQDPDVLFIGEIRDESTAEAAVNAAETGHLVISTMHTIDASETLNRFTDLFPDPRQRQVRSSLAGSLKAVICQRLLPRAEGWDRIPAVEVLVVNGRVADLILESGRAARLGGIIEEGRSYGMQTFEQALVELVRSGQVTAEEAKVAATNRHDFGLALVKHKLA